MSEKLIKAVRVLIYAAKPFLSDTFVTETSATTPLLDRLQEAIDDAQTALHEERQS